uniref:Uncharacterized protein n=1 Tax=Phlebotomus papatasi TaxID=29031 RepID=A0A1B0DAL2_PHLPP
MDGRMNLPKLPPVDIPKFTGKFKDWRDFFDIFTSVIHTNPSLGHVTKFQYLRSYLSGDAKQCIKHLQLTAQNYSAAIQILQNRFENKRAIISSYLDIVLEHKQLQHRSAEDILSLHDAINECMLALENMNYEITNWDTALVYIASKKLDSESQRLFEDHLTNPREMPTHKEFLEFLIKRHTVLKSSQKSSTKSEKQEKQGPAKKSFHSTTEESCPLCKDKHKLTRCDKFKDLSVSQRKQLVDKNKICLNCLGHDKKQKCSSKNTCRECQRKHHTLLHFPRAASENTHEDARSVPVQSTVLQAAQSDVSQVRESSSGEDVTSLTIIREQTVLLATCPESPSTQISAGHMLRALVDPGSQVSLITESAAQLLRLKKFKVNTAVKGIGGTTAAQCRHQAHMVIAPRFSSEFRLSVRALVNARLTNSLPDKERKPFTDDELSNIILADPEYYHPGPIDMILGADVYIEVVRNNIKKSKNGRVFAQNTHLGWILYAKSSDTSTQQSVTSMVGLKDLDIIQEECTSALLALDQVDEMMRRFWDMDDAYDTIKHPSVAEATFQHTTIRDQTGRDEFPETSKILIRDFYVDDLMSGADTKAEAILLQEQLRRLLENGGMNLRKWCSNDVAVLNGIPEHQQEIHPREFKPDSHIKTLGIIWSPNEDYFSFQTSTHDTKNLSKRQILSIISYPNQAPLLSTVYSS